VKESRTFWERLAARTTPSGALETIEDPMTLVRLATGALSGFRRRTRRQRRRH